MRIDKKDLTFDGCLAMARNFTNMSAWRNFAPLSYHEARRNDWLDVCGEHFEYCALFKSEQESKNALALQVSSAVIDDILEDLKRFSSFSQWKDESKEKYYIASERGWLKYCEDYFRLHSGKLLNLEYCLEEAKKYRTKTTWQNLSPNTYYYAVKNGLLRECGVHLLTGAQEKWTFEECMEQAFKFKTRSSWRGNSNTSYMAALKRGWLEKCLTAIAEQTNN